MPIVVAGAGGRLGAALTAALVAAGRPVIGLTRAECDLTDVGRLRDVVLPLRPEVLINCSAYNAVDGAEDDRATAFAINATVPESLARVANEAGALLIHYSSDFVFDGEASEPYLEDHPTNPLSAYGASKLGGEAAAQTAERHYVLRVESLFGGVGTKGHQTTIDLIANNMLDGKPVRAIADRTVSPSFVPDVIHATTELIAQRAPSGIYHCVNSGFTTWVEMATELARVLGVSPEIVPVQSTDFTTRARRPRFCALANAKLASVGVVMPTWQSAVTRHLRSRRRTA